MPSTKLMRAGSFAEVYVFLIEIPVTGQGMFLYDHPSQGKGRIFFNYTCVSCDGRFFHSMRTGTLRAILNFNGKLLRQFLGKINSKESSLARKGRHSLEIPRSSRKWMAELTATTSLLVPTVVYS